MIYIRYPSPGSSILFYLEPPTPFSVTTTTASGTGPNGIPIASVETPASVPVAPPAVPLLYRREKVPAAVNKIIVASRDSIWLRPSPGSQRLSGAVQCCCQGSKFGEILRGGPGGTPTLPSLGLGLARPLRPPLANLLSLTAHKPCVMSIRSSLRLRVSLGGFDDSLTESPNCRGCRSHRVKPLG